jgi:hypothetical protein
MTADPEDRPPVLGTWRAVYALVLGVLAALIGAFLLLGRTFS